MEKLSSQFLTFLICSYLISECKSDGIPKSQGFNRAPRSKRSDMSYQVEVVDYTRRILGEGPHWDHERQHLYFVDALNSSIVRFVPSENRTTTCKVDESAVVSIIIPVKGTRDDFLVTIGRNLTIVTWDGESERPQNVEVIRTVDEEPGKEENRFNDGKIDPTGRLWIGTMGRIDEKGVLDPGKGSVYSFPKGENPMKHVENVSISNGMEWSKDLKQMYYIDTPTKRLDVFDFDAAAGKISNRRKFFDFSTLDIPEGGGPDGMTIDTDGNLWVAVFGFAGVVNIDGKTGNLIKKVELPSKQITSVAFGGANLDELYVVSAAFLTDEEDLKKYPYIGCTFRVTGLGVKGYAGRPFEEP